jgi:hypothetical protein
MHNYFSIDSSQKYGQVTLNKIQIYNNRLMLKLETEKNTQMIGMVGVISFLNHL